jgi:ribA/ribD-fused uncharacterized protein
MDTVYFYSHRPEKYPSGQEWKHVFSNFSPHPIIIGGKGYSTSEHYYQSKKFEGTIYEEQVRLAPTPAQAAVMGRDKSLPLRADWEVAKDHYMRVALYAKFKCNDYLYERLMCTGDAHLEERTKNDSYWGTGSDSAGGTGKNMLGILLMELRAKLRT